MKRKEGFSLAELLIAVTILGMVIAISVTLVNFKGKESVVSANDLLSGFNTIEVALNTYREARGSYPITTVAGCDKTLTPVTSECLPNFIPYFLTSPPKANAAVSWVTTDYYLYHYDNTTGEVYLCLKTKPLDEYGAEALKILQRKSNLDKVFINTECGKTANLTDYVGKNVAITWWIVR